MTEVPRVAVLLLEIESRLHRAQQSVDRLGQMVQTSTAVRDGEYDEDYEAEKATLRRELEHIYTRVCTLLESLELRNLLENFKAEFAKANEHLTEISMGDESFDFNNDAVVLCWRYLGALAQTNDSAIVIECITKKRIFEAVLRNLPLIMADRGIDPKNETEVKRALYQTLRYIFPDTQREYPVPQITKNYSVDIVVESLRAAAELKFAGNIREAKEAVDQLYTDMLGCRDHKWESIYAVVYSPTPSFSQEQLETALKRVRADPKWKIIVLHGPGGRRPKK
jgi:REase_DpnII-MboI